MVSDVREVKDHRERQKGTVLNCCGLGDGGTHLLIGIYRGVELLSSERVHRQQLFM